ncbi:pentapeptide repeat-containing protein [Fulvivirga sp. RKSG066]|nr:pentapeptide repeat-containing protein [Fulvivirga aurantia]
MHEEDFKNTDYTKSPLPKGEYDNCSFTNCNFAESDLSEVVFLECEFINCDLSNAKIYQTAFRDVSFKDCKMLGLQFDQCNDFLFEIKPSGCQLNLSNFYQRMLKKAVFDSCSLHDVDFAEADLSGASFVNCDLTGAIFERTKLTGADMRGAGNFIIDPEVNDIKKARFALEGLPGLLTRYNLKIN